MKPDPLLALRAATASAHERLHGHPQLSQLAQGRLDREGYLALLHRLHGFHAAVEAALAAAPSLAPFGITLAERSRAPLLADDLASLGEVSATPARPSLPAIHSAPEALGWLYVTEGSTLGGRQLARALDPLLGEGATAGRRFLLGYGERHGAMWQACCAAIRTCGKDTAALAAMTGGAVAGFTAFESWFA